MVTTAAVAATTACRFKTLTTSYFVTTRHSSNKFDSALAAPKSERLKINITKNTLILHRETKNLLIFVEVINNKNTKEHEKIDLFFSSDTTGGADIMRQQDG